MRTASTLILVILALLAVPASAQNLCDLSMSISCLGGSCTSTTTNNSSTTCGGEIVSGFFAEATGATLSHFTTTIGVENGQCFDSSTLGGTGSSFVLCFGNGTLAPGASFQASVQVATSSAISTVPIVGLTEIIDLTSGDYAVVSAFNGLDVPTCTPVANVASSTLSGVPYVVSWTPTLNTQATSVVEESTKPDFSVITGTQTTGLLIAQFQHSVNVNTTYYYRVHVLSCNGVVGPLSAPVSIVVQVPPPSTSRGTDAVVPFGTQTPFDVPVTVAVPVRNGTFTATVDKTYLTVIPTTGSVPSDGQVRLTLHVTPGQLPPGANTGTVTVSTTAASTGTGDVQAQDGSTSVPVSVSLVTPVAPSSKTNPPANALIIPVVTHVNSSGGPFQSDVRVTNGSSGQVKYQITYSPTRTDATTSSKSTTIAIDGGQTIALNDIAKDFFGIGATGDPSDTGAGSLEIRPINSSSVRTFASSRTYVTQLVPSAGNILGTLGQFIGAVPFSQFATKVTSVVPGSPPPPPAVFSLQQVAESSKFRTNLGLVEGSGAPASGKIRVYNDAGTLMATVPFSLLPGEHQQLNHFISVAAGIPTLNDGRIEVTVESATGAVSGYASVLDNITSDPLAVMPAQSSLIQSSRFILPGIADLNTANNFHSDIRLYNGGPSDVVANLTYYPQGTGTPIPASSPVTIKSGEVKAFDNILPTLFGDAARNSGGSILVTTATPSSLVTTARTYSIGSDTGTYGQFIPGVIPSQGVGAADRPLQILQLEQSANFRSNIGVAELTGNPVHIRLSLVVPESKLATILKDDDLGPNRFVQYGFLLPPNTYNARVFVEVTSGTGKITAYGSVIDAATADPTYIPAQQ